MRPILLFPITPALSRKMKSNQHHTSKFSFLLHIEAIGFWIQRKIQAEPQNARLQKQIFWGYYKNELLGDNKVERGNPREALKWEIIRTDIGAQ